MAVRRQIKIQKDSISLAGLLSEMIENPELMTKERYLGLFTSGNVPKGIAEKEFETSIEEVMRRGIDALERELDPIDLSRFISELRRMQSGLPAARKRLHEGKSMEQIRKE